MRNGSQRDYIIGETENDLMKKFYAIVHIWSEDNHN